jgi:hypothetical protein
MSRSVFGVKSPEGRYHDSVDGGIETAKLYQTKGPATKQVKWYCEYWKQEWKVVEFLVVENLHNLS